MSPVKTINAPYKLKNNILQIDQRIKTYDYEFKMNAICLYVFDMELNCTHSSDLDVTFKKPLSYIFPEDVCYFFETLLKNTLTKPQMVHVNLNGTHLLYSTNTILDHTNNHIGIMLYQMPFTQVQTLQTMQKYDFLRKQINYIVELNGNIFAMEKLNWDLFIKNCSISMHENDRNEFYDRWKSDNIIHTNLFDMIENENTRLIYKRLFKHMITNETSPIRFCMYCNTELLERKLLITLSRFTDSTVYVLITSEIVEETENNQSSAYLHFEHVTKAKLSNKYVCDVCTFCKRIHVPVTEKELEIFKKHIIYYNNNLPPIYDNDINIPFMGKRGNCGQQSFKLLVKDEKSNTNAKVWMNNDEWKASTYIKETSNSTIYIKHGICDLCLDEWSNFFES